MSLNTDKPTALFVHCKTVYDAMVERSVVKVVHEGLQVRIYVGFLTRLIVDDLSLPNSYYTYVMNELKRMDCVRRYKRGGGASPSEWVLLKEPNADDFKNMPELTKPMSKMDIIKEQRFKNIEERLTRLEARALIESTDEDDVI